MAVSEMKREEIHCIPCEDEDRFKHAEGFCRECGEYMCKTCFNSHRRWNISRNHVLLGMNEEQPTSGSDQDIGKLESCQHHYDEQCKFYCQAHDQVGCGDCMIHGHKSCKVEYIRDMAMTFKDSDEFKSMMKLANGCQTEIKELASLVTDNRVKVKDIHAKFVFDVHTFRDEIIARVNKLSIKIIQKADKSNLKDSNNMETLEKEVNYLDKEISHVQKSIHTDSTDPIILFTRSIIHRTDIRRIHGDIQNVEIRNVIAMYYFQRDVTLEQLFQEYVSLGNAEYEKQQGTTHVDKHVEVVKKAVQVDPKSVQQPKSHPIPIVRVDDEAGDCVICMYSMTMPKQLKCGHKFCSECIEMQFKFKKTCPICGAVYGVITGDQPFGYIAVRSINTSHCSGYADCGQIVITYTFPDGRQQEIHPNPGNRYKGISRTAYLPNNHEGKQVRDMLKVAFGRKLVFTIGSSRTTGQEGVITWNDIYHKTDPRPHTQFGYPDKTYLFRVKGELADKGVTVDDIPK